MRDRYVIQVLLATFGFGLLLAVVAVLQTPGVFSSQGADRPVELRQEPTNAKATQQTTGAPHRTNDRKGDCDLPAKWTDDCPQPEPQKICQKTSSHEKTKTLAN